MTRKTGIASLLLAGAAAFGLYKLSKMSPTQRNELLSKGKELMSGKLGGLKELAGSGNNVLQHAGRQ